MKKKQLVTVAILIGIVGFITYTFIIVLKEQPVVLQGEIEATQVKISSKVPGRIEEIGVKKGQKVKKGDFMFSINSPEIDAKLAEATAARSAAYAQEQKADNGAQEEDIEAAYSTYVKAEAAASFAEKTYKRIENLHKEGVIPEQKKDEAETKMKAAMETAKAAKAIWQKAKKGARPEDKKAAEALVARADAAIKQVESYLDETSIKAIASGEVSGINAEQGELVSTGFPVVTLVNLDDIWSTFYIREDYLSHFQIGSTFKGKIPGLNNQEYEFEVKFISPAGDFARWTATKTSGEFDLKSFQVEARPIQPIEGLRPGMTVVVSFEKE